MQIFVIIIITCLYKIWSLDHLEKRGLTHGCAWMRWTLAHVRLGKLAHKFSPVQGGGASAPGRHTTQRQQQRRQQHQTLQVHLLQAVRPPPSTPVRSLPAARRAENAQQSGATDKYDRHHLRAEHRNDKGETWASFLIIFFKGGVRKKGFSVRVMDTLERRWFRCDTYFPD